MNPVLLLVLILVLCIVNALKALGGTDSFSAEVLVTDATTTSITFLCTNVELPFPYNTPVTVEITPTTTISGCSSPLRKLACSDLVNRRILVKGAAVSSISATAEMLQTLDDCSKSFVKTATLVELHPAHLVARDFNNVEHIFPFPLQADGTDGDTTNTQLTTCSWEIFTWAQTRPGDTLYLYSDIGATGTVELQEVVLSGTCATQKMPPIWSAHEFAEVVTITPDKITLRDILGDLQTFTLEKDVTVTSCNGDAISTRGIVPGETINVILENEARMQPRLVALSRVNDCIEKSELSGIVTALWGTEVELRLDNGKTVSLPLSRNCSVTDCSYQQRSVFDKALINTPASLIVEYTSGGPIVKSVHLELGCATVSVTPVEIRSIEPNSITVSSAETGVLFIPRVDIKNVLDENKECIPMSTLSVGSLICLQQATVDNHAVYTGITRNSSCLEMEVANNPGRIYSGVIRSTNGTEVAIEQPNGFRTILANANTQVLGVDELQKLQPGMVVRIFSKTNLYNSLPIAETILVAPTTTEVSEESDLHSSSQFLYPNPAQDIVTLNMNTSLIRNISLTSLAGIVAFQSKNISHLDVQNIPSGMYTVTIYMLDGSVQQHLLTVVH